jgi:hypothetical protein
LAGKMLFLAKKKDFRVVIENGSISNHTELGIRTGTTSANGIKLRKCMPSITV